MRFPKKRVIIPSVLICLLAVLYFILKLFLSGSQVRLAVIDSLAKKLNCNIAIDGATLGINRLTIQGLTLSYRKSQQIHEVAQIGTVTVYYHTRPFFKTGLFDGIRIEDAVVTIARDTEGWLTVGRIIGPRATVAPKTFDVELRRLRLSIADKELLIDSAKITVNNEWPKVNLALTNASVLNGNASGRAWFTIEEDAMLEAQIEANGIDLAEATPAAGAGDLTLTGLANCRLWFNGRASAPALTKKQSTIEFQDLSIRVMGQDPLFETARIAVVMELDEGPSQRRMFKARLERSLLDVTPWVHPRDTPDCLLARERMRSLIQGCPHFNATIGGAGLRLVCEGIRLPLDTVSGEIQKSGDAMVVKNVSADIAGGVVHANWRHYGTDTAQRYDGRATVREVGLAGIIEGTSLKGRTIGGKLTGEIDFVSAASAAGGPEGKGRLRIAEAQLWALPVLEKVAETAKLGERRSTKGAWLNAEFTLDNDMFRFGSIAFKDADVEITGAGDVYHTGEVDLRLSVTSKHAYQKNVPVLDDFVGILSDAFSMKQQTVRVTGPFTSPSTSLVGAPTVSPGKESAPTRD